MAAAAGRNKWGGSRFGRDSVNTSCRLSYHSYFPAVKNYVRRVIPAVLRPLMRHADIDTMLKFYVGSDAGATADVLRGANKKLGTNRGTRQPRIKLGN